MLHYNLLSASMVRTLQRKSAVAGMGGDIGVCGVAVLLNFLCGISVNELKYCGVAVIANPTACGVCAFFENFAVFRLLVCLAIRCCLWSCCGIAVFRDLQ